MINVMQIIIKLRMYSELERLVKVAQIKVIIRKLQNKKHISLIHIITDRPF